GESPAEMLIRTVLNVTKAVPGFGEVEKSRQLIGEAFTRGEEGRLILRDFRYGNATMRSWSWRDRLDLLERDLQDLRDGKLVHGAARDLMTPEEYKDWKDAMNAWEKALELPK
ncbi:MAG: hypothetical protein GWO44_01340, partial [Thermoplasmata archaeon]|nr:hypothetical protein [Thermoplasmata archaeon]NIY01937.1 hypothetical protein [Thermoplasmata archaeon]